MFVRFFDDWLCEPNGTFAGYVLEYSPNSEATLRCRGGKFIGTPMQNKDGPRHGGRVLVCDDNLLNAEVVAEFLRECGLEPMGPVGRLESAMQMARQRALDGAILDINLNGRPCFPICAILSARGIPFMFLTGYPHAAIPIEYRGAPLIAKPFEPNEMKEVMADMLDLPEGWPPPEHLRSDVRH